MRTFRTTWVFALVVAGVIGYSVYEYQRSQKETEQKAKAELLFNFAAADIKELTLQRSGERIQLQNQSGSWQILSPIVDLGDAQAISNFLEDLCDEKAKDVTSQVAETPIVWKDYGLEPATLQWEVTLQSGEKKIVVVSQNSAFDGSFYIRYNDRLYLGETSWAALNAKEIGQLRDKKLMDYKGVASTLEINNGWGQPQLRLKITKNAEGWAAEKSKSVLDELRIQNWLSDLKEMQASEFVAESSAKDLKPYGLNKPIFKAVLEFEKSGDTPTPALTLEIGKGKGPDEYFARSSLRRFIAKVNAPMAEKTDVILANFVDGRRQFNFDVEKVVKSVVNDGVRTLEVIKDSGQWKLVKEDSENELDGSQLEQLMQKLKSLEAREVMSPLEVKASFAMNKSIKLLDSAGQTVFDLVWGSQEFKPPRGKYKSESLTFARVSSTPDMLAMAVSDLNSLPLASLTKAKAKTDSATGSNK